MAVLTVSRLLAKKEGLVLAGSLMSSSRSKEIVIETSSLDASALTSTAFYGFYGFCV